VTTRIDVGSASDIDECTAIAMSLDGHFTAQAVERMPGDLRSQRLFVAREGGTVAGFISLTDAGDGVAEITWMAVRSDRHRQGVGGALLHHAEDVLASEGFRGLLVRTLAPSVEYAPYEATRSFYRAMGFALDRVMDPYPEWGPGNPCAVYVRMLGGNGPGGEPRPNG
jgi:GNAT superfamily N-acetyltransferase